MMGQGESHTESEAVYLKLENVLLTDHKSRYMMQRAFFPSQDFSPDWLYLNVCIIVNSVQPGGCGDFGGQSNFTYCQKFQWSSSALANLISIDQLLILDNVISESIVRITQHRKYLQFPLHIDSLPCYATEDDILSALLQLLPSVSTLFLLYDNICLDVCSQTNNDRYWAITVTHHLYEGIFIFISEHTKQQLHKNFSLVVRGRPKIAVQAY